MSDVILVLWFLTQLPHGVWYCVVSGVGFVVAMGLAILREGQTPSCETFGCLAAIYFALMAVWAGVVAWS